MTTTAIFCWGLIGGGVIGALFGYLVAWDEANALFERRYKRWRDHFERVTGKHYYR